MGKHKTFQVMVVVVAFSSLAKILANVRPFILRLHLFVCVDLLTCLLTYLFIVMEVEISSVTA